MRTRATILSTANDPNSVSLLFEEHFHSSTSRSDSEHRRYQRTAQRISSGAVCRHLNIAGRVAFFTIFTAYQPFQPKLQHIRLDAGERARAVSSDDSPGHWRDSLASAPTMAKGRTGNLASRQASARSSDRPIGQLVTPVPEGKINSHLSHAETALARSQHLSLRGRFRAACRRKPVGAAERSRTNTRFPAGRPDRILPSA